MSLAQKATATFHARYGRSPRVFRAPGRVNLIGEHTDYNAGFVLPCALELSTWVAAAARRDRRVRVYSVDRREERVFALDGLKAGGPRHWSDYVRGVAAELECAGFRLSGADVVIVGQVPIGAGLSSSAALEIASGWALLDTAGLDPEPRALALAAQQAEHRYAGTRCGLMDQYASCFGETDRALLLDCRSLEFELVPLPSDVRLLIADTGVRHELASGEYNRRRAQCEQGVRALRRLSRQFKALRDASLSDLRRADLPAEVFRRCRHVVTENARVLAAAAALRRGDFPRLGRLMDMSHESLRRDYEVSCAELDAMVGLARALPGVYGARMTGGGFGGCVVALVDAERAQAAARELARSYEQRMGVRPEIRVVRAGAGAGRVPGPFDSFPHRRLNLLTREWVLVSPHRAKRPWQGQVEVSAVARLPRRDPKCYLCPGNTRAEGRRNPEYRGTFVFDNDFPALLPGSAVRTDLGGLLRAEPEMGVCRVLCFSPRHDLALAQMDLPQVRQVVDAWAHETANLRARPGMRSVQIFENRGAAMGASNPHPHGQIWASSSIPNEHAKEFESFKLHRRAHRSCLLCDYAALEKDFAERVVIENSHFLGVVPFWAMWPFETLVISRAHWTAVDDLPAKARDAMADAIRRMAGLYDALFGVPFPYSMGVHQRPGGKADRKLWHLHAHFYPPLLRSASVRKFMVGYEMLASPQRDLTPESAAAALRCGRLS